MLWFLSGDQKYMRKNISSFEITYSAGKEKFSKCLSWSAFLDTFVFIGEKIITNYLYHIFASIWFLICQLTLEIINFLHLYLFFRTGDQSKNMDLVPSKNRLKKYNLRFMPFHFNFIAITSEIEILDRTL